MRKRNLKLDLHRETVLRLEPQQVNRAAGGYTEFFCSDFCVSGRFVECFYTAENTCWETCGG